MNLRLKLILGISVAILLGIVKLSAQETWLERHLTAVGSFLDDRAKAGLDTNFLAPPKHGFMVAATTSFAGINTTVKGNDIPTYKDLHIHMKSGLNGNVALAVGYRAISVKYSFNISSGYSRNFNFSFLNNSVGIEFRRHSADGMHGYMDASATPKIANVNKGDTRLNATIINGYFVFNSRRYSLPAAMGNGLIQKRSSGSVTVYGLYLNADLNAKNEMLSAMLGGLKKLEFYQAAAGIGYGYNYTPNRGKLLLHASAAPLVVFFTRSFVTAAIDFPLPDGTSINTEILKSVDPKHKIFLTAVARASAVYNINDHFILSLNALLNDVQFNSAIGLKVGMNDWIATGTVCYRF